MPGTCRQLLSGNRISHCLITVYSLVTFTSLAVKMHITLTNIICPAKNTDKAEHQRVLVSTRPESRDKLVEEFTGREH